MSFETPDPDFPNVDQAVPGADLKRACVLMMQAVTECLSDDRLEQFDEAQETTISMRTDLRAWTVTVTVEADGERLGALICQRQGRPQ